ncbi:helix-turn-helix transcriptional regulator [Acholeplasma equirhinis]|uniref:helix-turn-helix domain-containing protein n=1 Tax=Acholeplasma equirhinis TaxID=555393 RepID=UPI00197A8B9F|nr:helix-turn-helix transcriptional regulator [Acholeplasma equirhinis]
MKNKHIDTNNINYRLGQNIARLRVENGYSQEAFALECNISRAYYGRCELGLHSFTVDKLNLIANLLSVTVSDLFIYSNDSYI